MFALIQSVCLGNISHKKDSQVPEILVVVQVFVVDGREAALVGDVTVSRYKCVSEGSFVNGGKHKQKHFNKTKGHNKPI